MIPSLKIPLYGELDSIILHCMVCGELVFDNRYTMDELQERFDAVRPYKEWPCPHLQFIFALEVGYLYMNIEGEIADIIPGAPGKTWAETFPEENEPDFDQEFLDRIKNTVGWNHGSFMIEVHHPASAQNSLYFGFER